MIQECATLTKRQALFDLSLVLFLSAGYVAAENLSLPKRWIFPAIAVALVAFGIGLHRRGTDGWAALGFSRTGIRPAFRETALFTALAILLILGFAAISGRRIWYPSMAILLPLYPIYGIVQQGIFQGIVHRRLAMIIDRPWLGILVTAGVFALVHTGNAALVGLTFVSGLAWSLIYSRHPNLWPLGLSHGLLAALAYPLILGDDPLQRL